MPEKLSIEDVNRMDRDKFAFRFGSLFENSPWVALGAWVKRPFEDLDGLHRAFVEAVDDASTEKRITLIQAHPDLAGKAALAGDLTDESAREQASAGLDRLSPEEYERFHRLNRSYRERFDLPFVVCVRDHTKETILASAERRLEHTKDEEIEAALGEVSRISRLRLEDLVEGSAKGGGSR